MKHRTNRALQVAGITGAVAGTAAAGWTLYSKFFVNHNVPLASAISAGRHAFRSPAAGDLSYYLDTHRPGVPLLLVHSINAAASSYEMRPLFDVCRGERPVYALDLPGFGFSARGDRDYSPELYASAIRDFLELVIGEDRSADVVALSLSGEFCARAAAERPELFRSLTVVSPTGFDSRGDRGPSPASHAAFGFPLWSQAFFDLLTTPASIRYYLRKSFAGPIDRGLADYDYATSHQPGARYAPLHFISGKLNTPDIRDSIYARLTIPVQVLYDRDGYVNFDRLPAFVEQHPNWRAVRIPDTAGLPHYEKPRETLRALNAFWTAPMPAPLT